MPHSAEEIQKHVRVYLTVFASLAVLTIVTVLVSYLPLETGPAIALALTVASLKAFLVAAYFMHLITEKRIIHGVLGLTALFFLLLLILPAIP